VLGLTGGLVVLDSVLAYGRFAPLADAATPPGTVASAAATWWPWVAVVGGVAIATGGVVAAARGGRWAAMSQRYEPPGAGLPPAPGRTPSTTPDPDAAWRALDRGEDPTLSG
jgi:hypothetical protein